MLRIALYSEDRHFQRRLSSILGNDFEVLLAQSEAAISQLIAADDSSVCLLHLSSGSASLSGRITHSRRLIESRVNLMIAADDDMESAAADLIHLGAKRSFRTAGCLCDLKAALGELNGKLMAGNHQRAMRQLCGSNKCDGLIGSSATMHQVYELIELVADLPVSVFVTGESGTGKELIARAIHNLGTRSSEPFVAVSCGAIPDTLFETELFGHEKGAFTGTVGSRVGYFEEAGCGTLFLDEIGDLTLAAQVKLLRVLQQREFNRLGRNRLIPLRARVIFATHQDLDEMVARGAFRRDLYYRLDVVRINAPALRDHADDIPQIITHFLRLYSEIYNLPQVDIDPHALSLLQAYAWPGNVRELEHIVQSAVILSRGRTIQSDVLPPHIQREDANIVSISGFLPEASFEKQLIDYKVRLASAAVQNHDGNKTLAARSLHISRAYLHRLLRLGDPERSGELDYPEMEAG